MTLDQEQVDDALPSYEIGGELGRGGWGVVLAGRHRQLGREVAIKQLPRAFAADVSIRARFTVEARLLASLDHPHIVPVYDYVEQDGLCLLVMELLPGGTVWSRFSTEGFTATGRHRRRAGLPGRAPGGPRPPRAAPRREAGEPDVLGLGCAEGHRLRHRQGRGRRGDPGHAGRRGGGHARLHRARTGPRRRPLPRHRRLRGGHHALRAAVRASCPSPTTATPWR